MCQCQVFHLMSAPHSLLPGILQSMEAVYSNVANKASGDSNGVSRNFLTRKWKPSQHDRKYISCADVIFVLCHHQTRLEMWEKIDIQFYSALEAALSDFLPNIPTFVIFLLSTNILLVTEQHNIFINVVLSIAARQQQHGQYQLMSTLPPGPVTTTPGLTS